MRNKLVTLSIEDMTSGTVSSPVAGSGNSGETTLASGGTYGGQEFSAVYTITALSTTVYGLTCDFGADKDLDISGVVSFGAPIAMGTAGLTATFTDVSGPDDLVLGDTWSIDCAGGSKIIDCKMETVITSKDQLNTKTVTRFPRRISIPNATGKDLSFNILSNDDELDEYLDDSTDFDLIPVADSTTVNYTDIYPLPTPEYLVINNSEGGTPSAALEIQLVTYYPRSSR
ncbi:MAG: hypothetical protein GY853_09905 [PVC group bacterium]|nr:hypothetical protein [PVC group bacterium]